MNLPVRLWLFLLAGAAGAFAAECISADQLEQIVQAGLTKRLTDAQIAHSLTNAELTERLASKRLESLLETTGPRTRDVIQILADVSAFLDAPAAAGADAPPAEQQRELLARARGYTVGYIHELPDFVTTRVTRRFDDYPFPMTLNGVWRNLVFRDSTSGQLSYSQGKESYTDQSEGRVTYLPGAAGRGLTSFGEFGSIIAALFLDESQTQFIWRYWETVADKRLAVFHYAIAAEHSRYVVSYCCDHGRPESLAAAYRGDLYIDPVSGGIWRVTRQSVDIPRAFPTHWAQTIVDYRPQRIGGEWRLAPVRSSSYSETVQPGGMTGAHVVRYWNDVRFVGYHRFTAETRLLTGAETETAPETAAAPPPGTEPWLEVDPSLEPPPEPEATAPLPAAQPPAATIRTSVRLVEVPVIVKDRGGAPVHGLKKEDFEVTDNGQRQDVQVFVEDPADGQPAAAAIRAGAAAPKKSRPSNAAERQDGPNESTYILVDPEDMDWAERAYLHLELLKFLQRLPASEKSRTFIFDGREFVPLTDTAGVVSRLSMGRDIVFNPLAFRPTGDAAKWRCPPALHTAEVYLKALAGVAQQLEGVPGRKTLVWVSAAFPLVSFYPPASCTFLMPPLVKIMNDAKVSVYPVDAPGLKTAFADASTEVPMDRKTLARTYDHEFVKSVSHTDTFRIYAKQTTMLDLSDGSGGRAFLNANDIAWAMATAIDDPRGSYRLGFYPEVTNDGQYHRIRVTIVGRPELRVRYRAGYFDKPAASDGKKGK